MEGRVGTWRRNTSGRNARPWRGRGGTRPARKPGFGAQRRNRVHDGIRLDRDLLGTRIIDSTRALRSGRTSVLLEGVDSSPSVLRVLSTTTPFSSPLERISCCNKVLEVQAMARTTGPRSPLSLRYVTYSACSLTSLASPSKVVRGAGGYSISSDASRRVCLPTRPPPMTCHSIREIKHH